MAGRADLAARRRAKRAGRERGCWLYIPWEQLQMVGFRPSDPPPWYRTWEDRGGRPRLVVNLYKEP